MACTNLSFFIPFVVVDEGTYDISVDGKIATIDVKFISRCKEDFHKLTGFTYDSSRGSSVRILGDVWGVSGFTKITFQTPYLIPIQDARIEAQRYLNRLIKVWRCHTRKHWVHYVPDSAILNFEGESIDDSGEGWKGFTFRDPKRLLYPVKTREAVEVIDEIKMFLKNEKWVPIYEELRLNARNHFINGQFNLAVIEMNIALESLAARYLREKLRRRGLEEDKVQRRMNTYLSKNYGLSRILHETFQEEDNRSLKKEAKLWERFIKARNIRKNSVHPWVKELAETEAREALYTFEEIMRWIMT